jgi:DNA invertase Pin-like site-specific DNA recombinase
MRRTKLRTNATVIAYLRVSTEEQHLGPEAQRAAIEEWAARSGKTVAEVHADQGVSGAAPLDKRPGLGAALEAVRRTKASALVVAKLDRLARDATLAGLLDAEIRRLGAKLVSADGVGQAEGAEGELIKGIMNQFAAYERALIKARTSAALRAKRRRGENPGQVPYGFVLAADGVRLIELEREQVVIRYIIELRGSGLSFRAIVDRLNAEGVPARPKNRKGAPQGVGVPGRWHLPAVFHLVAAQRAESSTRAAATA